MYVKIFGSMLDSSIWTAKLETRVLWISMLAMADEHGLVYASVVGLARRANLTVRACTNALAELEAPDPDSRTREREGRRIEAVEGGWLLLNYQKYREIRTRAQRADAQRQKRCRERRSASQNGVTSHNDHASVMAVTTTASASASSSVVPIQEKEKQKKAAPVDPLIDVLAIAHLELDAFGQYRTNVEGFLRAARSPLAVAQILASHLPGEHSEGRATHETVGLAVREFQAQDQAFNARFFAAFVTRAEKAIKQRTGTVANANAARFDNREAIEQERADREESEIVRKLAEFKRTEPEAYARYQEQAENAVDARVKGIFRPPTVRANLVQLIEKHREHAG